MMGPLNRPHRATLVNPGTTTDSVQKGNSSAAVPPGTHPASFGGHDGTMAPQPGEVPSHTSANNTGTKLEYCIPPDPIASFLYEEPVTTDPQAINGVPEKDNNLTASGLENKVPKSFHGSGGISPSPMVTDSSTNKPADASPRFSAGLGLAMDEKTSAGFLVPKVSPTVGPARIAHYEVRSPQSISITTPSGTEQSIQNARGDITLLQETAASPQTLQISFTPSGSSSPQQITTIVQLTSTPPAGCSQGYVFTQDYPGITSASSTTTVWFSAAGANPAKTIVIDAAGIEHTTTSTVTVAGTTVTRTAEYKRKEGTAVTRHTIDQFLVKSGEELLTSSTIVLTSSGTTGLTNSYTYWDVPGTANHQRLQSEQHYDGSWKVHALSDDGLTEYTITPWQSTPLSALALTPSKSIASLLTAAASTSNPCRLQTTVYTDGNGAVWGNNTPKGIIGIDLVSVKGIEISRQQILDGLYVRTINAAGDVRNSVIPRWNGVAPLQRYVAEGRLNDYPGTEYINKVTISNAIDGTSGLRITETIEHADSAARMQHKTHSESRKSDGRQDKTVRSLIDTSTEAESIIEVLQHTYNAQDKQTATLVNGFESEAWSYPNPTIGASAVTHRSADGMRRTTEYDAGGRTIKETLHGSSALSVFGVSLPLQADIVTTWSFTPRTDGAPGEKVTTIVTAGAVSRTTVEEFEGAGRRTSIQNPDGSARNWAYTVDAALRYVTTEYAGATGAGGALKQSARYADGRLAYSQELPNAQRTYIYEVPSNYTSAEEEWVSGTKVQRIERDALGRIVRDEHLQSVVAGSAVYENSLVTYDANYEIKSRSRAKPTTGAFYEVWQRTYDANGVLTIQSGTSADTEWDEGDQNLRKTTIETEIDSSIATLTVADTPVLFAWRKSATYMPAATSSPGGWESAAARIQRSPLSERRVIAAWLGHTADSFPVAWSNEGGTIYSEAETRSLSALGSGGVLASQRRIRRGTSGAGEYRKVIDKDGVDYFFSSPDAANVALTYNAFREPLKEYAWESMPHWPGLERNSVGQVTGRLLPGSTQYTEKYTYFATGTDHRVGRLRSRETLTYAGGGAGATKGTTFFHYNALGQVLAEWGSGTPTTLYSYDVSGRMTRLRTYRSAPSLPAPDDSTAIGTALTAAETAATVQITEWGYIPVADLALVSSKKYPGQSTTVDYTYNADGSLATRTWERTDGSNRLRTRYGYSDHRQLTSIDYGSTIITAYPTNSPFYTPSVTFGYDRAGRVRYRGDSTGHTRMEYRYDGSLLTELPVLPSSEADAVVASGKHLRRTFDSYGRQTMLEASWGDFLGSANSQGSYTHSPYVTYGYSTADRLSTITSAGFTGTITRTASQDSISIGTSGMMYPPYSTYNTIAKSATGLPSQHTAMYAIGYNNQSNAIYSMSSSAFTWDSNRLATRGGENGGATKWNYTYDAKGQVASAKKTFVSGGANFKGTETLYYYDNIGNRDVVKEGPTLRETNYVTNERNQYTSVARPAAQLTAQVVGQRSNSTAKIKINSNDSAVLENVEYLPSSTGLYFYKEIANTPSSPASGDIFEPLYATQNGVDITPNQADFAFVGASSITPQYDLDGNIIYDGRWTYTWDGENRLIKMSAPVWTQPTAGGYQSPEPGGNTIEALTMQFTYDGLSRRVTKTVTGGTTGTSREGYLYDGWNVIMVAQLDATSGPTSGAFQLRKWSCIWKPDVGSSLHARSSWQGAGGVGGLAWMQTGIAQAYYPPYQMGSAEIHIPMADHMGNIRHYFQIKSVAGSVTGQISGNLEYDAFGREVRAWGTTTGATPPPGLPVNRPFIDQLPFHFSSKFTDQESGFNYYGYRFYNADWGRWLNRDPIGEEGGLNIYTLVRNRAANLIDILGLNEAGTTNPGQDGDTCRITILVGHSSTARGLINGVKLPSTENLEGSDRVACVTCNRKSTNANLPADKQIPGDPNSRIDNYIFPGQESDMKKHEDYDKERGDETVKKAYEKELENVKSYAKNKLCACCPLGVEIRVRGIDDDGIEWVTHNVNGLVKDSGKLGVRLRLNPCDTASLK